MGGAIDVTGNVATDPAGMGTPGPAEWNVYADPAAADAVFRSGIPITLVPLDATNDVPVDAAFVGALEADHTAAGADVAYELLARVGVTGFDYLWDALAAVVAVDETVATIEPMTLAVVTEEGPDSGRTIRADDGAEIRVATGADRAAFEERFLAGLRVGAPRANPFTLVGTISVTFDGTTCVDDVADTIAAGDWRLNAETTVAGTTVPVVVQLPRRLRVERPGGLLRDRSGPDRPAAVRRRHGTTPSLEEPSSTVADRRAHPRGLRDRLPPLRGGVGARVRRAAARSP